MENLSLYTHISLVNKLNTAKKVVSNFGHPFLHTENVKIIVQIKFCWADEIQLFGFRRMANRRRQTPPDAIRRRVRRHQTDRLSFSTTPTNRLFHRRSVGRVQKSVGRRSGYEG